MNTYRISRNVEASLVDQIKEASDENWDGIRCEKSFSEVYKGTIPCFCVNVLNRPVKRHEIGSSSIFKDFVIEFRVFANSDGQRLDLADWLLDEIVEGFDYFEYTISSGSITEKQVKGRINLLTISEDTHELKNTENLAKEDRYRHLIRGTFRIAVTS